MLDAMISYLWPEAMASLTFVGEERDPSDADLGPDLVSAARDRYLTAAAVSVGGRTVLKAPVSSA
jgi:hypothetical protein